MERRYIGGLLLDHPMPFYDHIQTGLSVVFLAVLCIAAAAFVQKDILPAPSQIHPALFQEPLQTPTSRETFSFFYAGENYFVEPLFDYELNGLVVSHNNPTGFADFYHDERSVDTKDLCVIYGNSLKNGAYLFGDFWSGSFTCYFQVPYGLGFQNRELSNNHLITDDASLRRLLSNVRIGDQIHIKGMLVKYTPASNPDAVRGSSITRDDTGGFACEVVYMEALDIVKAGGHFWHKALAASFPILVILVILKLVLMVVHVHLTPKLETREALAAKRLGRISPEEHDE